MRLLAKSCLIRPLNFRFISTSAHLHQELQLAEPPPPQQTPLPPNPAFGSPLYKDNWRNATFSDYPAVDAAAVPASLGFLRLNSASQLQSLSQMLDANGLMDQFAQWMTSKRWADVKQLFELWINNLDNHGKPNKPDVNLYNQYLQVNLKMGASAGQLLDLVMQMDGFGIFPNTASFNIVLKAMQKAGELVAAEKLIERSVFVTKYEVSNIA